MTSLNEIAHIIRATIENDFAGVRILDVNVTREEDADGEETLRVEVIFEGPRKDLNARRLSGVVRHVRPRLNEIGEHAFPLFSFISKGDAAGGRALEPA